MIDDAEGYVTKDICNAFGGNKQLSGSTARCTESGFDNAPVNLAVLLNMPRMPEQIMSEPSTIRDSNQATGSHSQSAAYLYEETRTVRQGLIKTDVMASNFWGHTLGMCQFMKYFSSRHHC